MLTNLNIANASQGVFTLIHVIGGFGPTIAAICVLPKKTPKEILRFVFNGKKNSFWYLLLFCVIQGVVIGLSSLEINPQIPWYAAPIVLLSATIVGGGNEELGWRGILQPELEKKLPFPMATLITGCIYGLILSVWLATIYKKTKNVFSCVVFHGLKTARFLFSVIKTETNMPCPVVISNLEKLPLTDLFVSIKKKRLLADKENYYDTI